MYILRLNMHFTMVKVQAFFVHYLSVKCLCRSNQGLYFYGAQPCCCAFLFVRKNKRRGKEEKMEKDLWWYVIGAIIGLTISIAFCVKFKGIAEDKGYEGQKYFWLCFFFGLIGYIYVAALPDLELRSRIRNMQEPMEKANHVWKCTKCGAQNPSGSVLCKGCGEYR